MSGPTTEGAITPEVSASVTELLASMKEHGQLVLGIVAEHPEMLGHYLGLDCNRRALVCAWHCLRSP